MPIARATNAFLQGLRERLDRVAAVQDDELRENYTFILRKTAEILEAHATQEAAIAVDRYLSEAGQIARIREVAAATLKKLSPLLLQGAEDAARAYTRLQAVLSAIPDAPKDFSDVVQFLREQEIRMWLRGLSPSERMTKYALAVEQDKVETVRAFKLAPGEPLIDLEIVERFDRQRLEATKPRDLVRLDSLAMMRDQLKEVADHLFLWLSGYGATWASKDKPTPPIPSAQHLVGFGNEVKFPTAPIKAATNLT